MATNKNNPWREHKIPSSRELSDKEMKEVNDAYSSYSLKRSVQNTINSLIHGGANIKDDKGMLIMDMDTLLRIVREYCYE